MRLFFMLEVNPRSDRLGLFETSEGLTVMGILDLVQTSCHEDRYREIFSKRSGRSRVR